MRFSRLIALSGLVALSIAAGVAAALRLTRPQLQYQFLSYEAASRPITSQVSSLSEEARNRAVPSENTQADTLELPKASPDFVGYWGGYVHSSMQRFNPDLIGKNPDRVSVIFGRAGGTIFVASDLYTSPQQKIVRRPTVRVVRTRRVIVEYKSTDNRFYYFCSHHFQLDSASIISYDSKIDVYDRSSRTLVGIVTEHATLKRLRSPREQLEFARPSPLEVPRAGIWATAKLTH